MKHMNIRTIVVAISVFLVSVAGGAIFAETAQAAPVLVVKTTVINDMQPTIIGMALAECLANDTSLQDSSYWLAFDRISASNASSGQWYNTPPVNGPQNDAHISYLYPPNVGFTHCSDSTFITNAVKTVGFDSTIGGLCGLDFGRVNGSDCINGSGDFKQLHHLSFDTYYGMIKTLNKAGVLTDVQRYLFYMQSMITSCNATISDSPGNPEYTWTADVVELVNNQGVVTTGVNYIGTAKASDRRDIAGSPNTKNLRCDEMAKMAKQFAPMYAAYLTVNKDVKDPPIIDVALDKGTVTSSSGTKTTCAIATIGWVVCPVVNFMATMADGTKGVLDGMLEIKATSLFDTTGSSGSLYSYWQQMRNIANILFVIGFLVIIYSQITGAGVSNYGLKKLLPKLIIVAVLVNVSFWLCAVAVDLSNLLGYSLDGLLGGALQQGAISDPSGLLTGGTPFASLTGKVLAGGIVFVAGAAALYFFLGALVTGLIGMLFAAITAVIVIGIRAALITLLIVISPLAMAALLLPNTESLTKKWLDLFKGLLLVFPVISLLYGAGKLASRVLQAPSGDFGILINFIGAILPFIMLFAGYSVLKKALDAVNGAGAFIGGIGKVRGMAESKGKSAAENSTLGQASKYTQNKLAQRQSLIRSGAYTGRGGKLNPGNWSSSAHRAFNRGKISGEFGNKMAASGVKLADDQTEEEVKAAEVLQQSTMIHSQRIAAAASGSYQDKSGKMVKVSRNEREAAVKYAMTAGAFDERGDVLKGAHDMDARQLRAVAAGARAKGDGAVYGQVALGQLEQGLAGSDPTAIKAFLDTATTSQIEKGELSIQTAMTDTKTAAYVKDQANASTAAKAKMNAMLTKYKTENAQEWSGVKQAVRDELDKI